MQRKLPLITIALFTFISFSCQDNESLFGDPEIDAYYIKHRVENVASLSTGSVGNGTLENGHIVPFKGKNFQYFDKTSYLKGSGFLNGAVLQTVLNTYEELNTLYPNRKFYIMETANKNGGKLPPHRTHQNGLSVDFMMPKTKNGKADYTLDEQGMMHYLLSFDDNGNYSPDNEIKIDFDLVAHHILLLDEEARKIGLKVKKVIIKIELKDELYGSKFGKELKNSGIYVVKALDKLTNALHDDHFHIDFEPI